MNIKFSNENLSEAEESFEKFEDEINEKSANTEDLILV